jgi:hypothetical protein
MFNSYPRIKNKFTVESVGKILGKSNGIETNNDETSSSRSGFPGMLDSTRVLLDPVRV